MFTGIVQGVAQVVAVHDQPGLRQVHLRFPPGFDAGLALGASVACDGVCLTVAALPAADEAAFDVMAQTLSLTTAQDWRAGDRVNVERAARDGAEIGGHPLSGHIDTTAQVLSVQRPQNNHVLRLGVPPRWMRYVFAKGYIAVNGASLTVAEADRAAGWFEVWLIPETLRLTTFGDKAPGDRLNLEIERQTQVIVDTVHEAVQARLGPLLPTLERWAAAAGTVEGDAARDALRALREAQRPDTAG